MAFGFGSFGGSLLGALGMPQTGGVTGQPSVDPNALQIAPDVGGFVPPQNGGWGGSGNPIYGGNGDTIGGVAQPFQPMPGAENPGGQMMPPASGGVFGGGAHTGPPPMSSREKRWAKNPKVYGYTPPSGKPMNWEGVPVQQGPFQMQQGPFQSFADMVKSRMQPKRRQGIMGAVGSLFR